MNFKLIEEVNSSIKEDKEIWNYFLFYYKKIKKDQKIEKTFQFKYLIENFLIIIQKFYENNQLENKKNYLEDKKMLKIDLKFEKKKENLIKLLYYYIELYEYLKIKYKLNKKEDIYFINDVKKEINFNYNNYFFSSKDSVSLNFLEKYVEFDKGKYISINENFIFIKGIEDKNLIKKYIEKYPNKILCSDEQLEVDKKEKKNYFLSLNKDIEQIQKIDTKNYNIRNYKLEDYNDLKKFKEKEGMFFPSLKKYKQLINSDFFNSKVVFSTEGDIVFTAHTNEIKNKCIIYGVQLTKEKRNNNLGKNFLLYFINELIEVKKIRNISLFCDNASLKKYYESIGFENLGFYYEYYN